MSDLIMANERLREIVDSAVQNADLNDRQQLGAQIVTDILENGDGNHALEVALAMMQYVIYSAPHPEFLGGILFAELEIYIVDALRRRNIS